MWVAKTGKRSINQNSKIRDQTEIEPGEYIEKNSSNQNKQIRKKKKTALGKPLIKSLTTYWSKQENNKTNAKKFVVTLDFKFIQNLNFTLIKTKF